MKEPARVQIGVRVTPETRELIKAEQRRTGESWGRIVDRVVGETLGPGEDLLERYGANRPLSLVQRFRVWIGWV